MVERRIYIVQILDSYNTKASGYPISRLERHSVQKVQLVANLNPFPVAGQIKWCGRLILSLDTFRLFITGCLLHQLAANC